MSDAAIQPPADVPAFGEDLEATHPSEDLMRFLLRRRSTVAKVMTEPGPSRDQLSAILAAGARVPDHGKLAPWRFILFEGQARAAMGDVLQRAFKAANPAAPSDQVEFEGNRFLRAPIVIGVVSIHKHSPKIPEWEQILSAGAVCQTMLLAGQAQGFAGQWLSEWYAYDRSVLEAMGLARNERIAGFLYFGTTTEVPCERVRPDLAGLVSHWQPAKAAAPASGAPAPTL